MNILEMVYLDARIPHLPKHVSMKKGLPILGLAGIALTLVVLFQAENPRDQYRKLIQSHPYSQRENLSPEDIKAMPKKDRPDLAWEQDFLATLDPALGRPAPERLVPIYHQIAQHKASHKQSGNANWIERGPNNVGGRTRSIMFDPNDPTGKKVWAGGVSGGLWYNNDITDPQSNWVAVNDFWANIAISSMAYDPTNTNVFYVGTGEGFGAGSGRGAGVWKSMDGGASWTQLPATSDFYYVNDLVVRNEGGNGVLYVACRGYYYQQQWHGLNKSGLQRSTDGGGSFSQVLPLIPGESVNFIPADLEIAANNRLWMGTMKTPYSATDQGGGRIFYSDNGTSWTQSYNATNGSRVEIACAPSNINYVYGMVEFNGEIEEMVKTTTGGISWSNMTEPNDADGGISASDFSRGQAWYDMIIAVHPTNENMVFTGAIDLFQSSDAGANWNQISHWYGGFGYPYVHADQHQMAFNPFNPNQLLVGNDGGLHLTSNASQSSPTWTEINQNYNVTQFYACALHPGSGSHYALAGSQDNGTQRFSLQGLDATTQATGGDGGYCFIDQTDPTYQITSYVYNSFWRSIDGGQSFGSMFQSNQNTGRFINPADYDDNLDILYSAETSTTLNRVTGISSSINISSINIPGMNDMASHIRVSPYTTNTTTLFVGTDAGTLFKVTNADTNPSATSIGSALPAGNISCIELGANENEILVTFTNYGLTSVYYTADGGQNWVSKEGNLPDMPVRWALFNPNNRNEVMLATEVGVWTCSNFNSSSPTWSPSVSGLANVRVDMLQLRSSDHEVIAATFGRGLFTTNAFQIQVAPTANFGASNTHPCLGESVTLVDSSLGGVTNYDWTITPGTFSFTGGTNASSASPELSFQAKGTYTVKLKVTNGSGSDSLSRSSFIQVGGASLPISLDFENGLENWTIENPDQGTTWALTSVAGNTPGSTALYVDNYNYSPAGQRDYLVSPALDLKGLSSVNLDFEYAYNRYGTSYQDSLAIYASSDCGQTWTQVVLFSDDGTQNWATGPDNTSAFSPSSSSNWCGTSPVCPTVNLDAYAGMDQVKIRFENICGWGNNFYLDNISISGLNNGQPVADFQASELTICQGDTVLLTDQSTNSPTAWTWTLSPASGFSFISGTSASSQNPILVFNQSGSYSVSLDASNAQGSDTEVKSNYLSVSAKLTPSVSAIASDTSFCAGTLVNFSSNPVHGGPNPSYVWKVNGGVVGTGASYSSNSLNHGDQVTVEMVSSELCVSTCCAVSSPITMNVASPNTPTVSISPSANNVCEGTLINFTSNINYGGSNPVFQWKLNGNNVGSNSPNYSSSSLQNGDQLILVMTSNEDCVSPNQVSSNTLIMSILSKPTVTINPASINQDLCQGDSVVLSGNPSGGAFQGIGIQNGVFFADLAGTGTHLITYTYTDGNNCTNTDSLEVSVEILPEPTIGNNQGVLTCNEAGFAYQWHLNGNPINGANSQTYTPSQNGDYTVVISQGDCEKESAVEQVMGIHLDEWLSVQSLQAFPIPANEFLQIDIQAYEFEEAEFQLIDMYGKTLVVESFQIRPGFNSFTLETGYLPSGHYVLKAKSQVGFYYQSLEIVH